MAVAAAAAAPITVLGRFNDDGYKNWLRVGQALSEVRNGLCDFTTDVIQTFHRELLTKHTAGQCGAGGQPVCKSKTIKMDNLTKIWSLTPPCVNRVCDGWLADIAAEHDSKKVWNLVYWSNTTVEKWPTTFWEVAKVYMNKGQKAVNTEASKTDTCGLLALIGNCGRFGPSKSTSKKKAQRVTEVRNKLMHSSTLSFTNDEMKNAVATMVTLLEDTAAAAGGSVIGSYPDAQTAIKVLCEIRDMDLDISCENVRQIEMDLLKDRLDSLEDRMSEMQTTMDQELQKAAFATTTLITGSPDLVKKLQKEVCELMELMGRVAELERKSNERFGAVENTCGNLQEQMDELRNKIDSLPIGKASGADGSIAISHKNLLQQLTDKNHLPKAEYRCIHDESGQGWVSEVTVNGQTFRSLRPHPKIVHADQDAAAVALKDAAAILETNQKSVNRDAGSIQSKAVTAGSDVPAGDSVAAPGNAKKALKELLDGMGCGGLKYNTAEVQADGGNTFRADVSLETLYFLQGEPQTKKTQAEQTVAKTVTDQYSIPKSGSVSSEKSILSEYCRKMNFPEPKFFTEPAPEKSFLSVIGCRCITDKHTIVVHGDTLAANKRDAEQSVARKALAMFAVVGVSAKVKGEAKVKSPSPGAVVSTQPVRLMNAPAKDMRKSVTAGSDAPAGDSVAAPGNAKQALKELLEGMGCGGLKYNTAEVQADGGNKFRADVSLETLYFFQGEPQTKETQAEQTVAKTVTDRYSIPKSGSVSSEKSILSEYCRKIDFPEPKFFTEPTPEKSFLSVIGCRCITDKHTIVVHGDTLAANKRDAEQSVARKALAMFADVGVSAKVKGEAKVKSPSPGAVVSTQPVRLMNAPAKDMRADICPPPRDAPSPSKPPSSKQPKVKSPADHCARLCQICKSKRHMDPIFDLREENSKCQAKLTMEYCVQTTPMQTHSTKKDAEKYAAQYALKVLYPNADCSDVTLCKNLLQEAGQKQQLKVPTYTPTPVAGGGFQSSITVQFVIQGQGWHDDPERAKQEVAKSACDKLGI